MMTLGCANPIMLKLDAPGIQGGTVRANRVYGDSPASPSSCSLPCGMLIAPGTAHDLHIEAPGHYPANFQVTYLMLLQEAAAGSGEWKARLVVPLVPSAEGVP